MFQDDRHGSRALLGALLALVGPLMACDGRAPPDAPRAPNTVVLVTLDTTRYDRTALGGRAENTPRLGRLAADGITFARAYATVPVTLPSHASLFTGRSPVVHGLRQNGLGRLDPAIPVLTERFRSSGYATGAFVSSVVLEPRFGLERGFDAYDAPPARAAERAGRETAARAVSWLRARDANARVFLWLHLYDAHAPYAPPADVQAPTPYEGELVAADRALGDLLDALADTGREADALIVVAADHGEGLGDHGEEEHGMFVYEEAIHVPLVMRLPRRREAGTTVEAVVSLVDVAPTLVAACGLDPLPPGEGRDLLAAGGAARGADGSEAGRFAYAETWVPREAHGFAPLFAAVEARFKYIEAPIPELYDLAADPRETRNRLGEASDQGARLAARLLAERGRLASDARLPERVVLRAGEREAFAELGYTGGGARGGSGIDPKQGILLHNMLREAAARLRRDDAAGALELTERVQGRDPGNRSAALLAAKALAAAGRAAEGIAQLEAQVGRDPEDAEAWIDLGVLRGPADPAGARAAFERATALADDNFEAWFDLGLACERGGDAVAAASAYERALALDPTPGVNNALAWLLATAAAPLHDATRARALAQAAVAAEPANPEFRDTLAEALAGCDDLDGAVREAREAVRLAGDARPDLAQRLQAFETRRARRAEKP